MRMEINTVYCAHIDEDIFESFFEDAEIHVTREMNPSNAIYVDEEGIFFSITLNKKTKEANMVPTGVMLVDGKQKHVPITNIVAHLKQRKADEGRKEH